MPPFGGWHVDHVVPLCQSGGDVIDNLCAGCPPCNLSKGARSVEEFRLRASGHLGRLFPDGRVVFFGERADVQELASRMRATYDRRGQILMRDWGAALHLFTIATHEPYAGTSDEAPAL